MSSNNATTTNNNVNDDNQQQKPVTVVATAAATGAATGAAAAAAADETAAPKQASSSSAFDNDLVTVLMRHIESGDLRSVQNVASNRRVGVNCALAESLDTPLHVACLYGHREIVQWLLRKGANVNAVNAIGSTPLHKVAISKFDQFFVASSLIKAGADTTLRNSMGLLAADLTANMKLRERLLGSSSNNEVVFRFPRDKVPALVGKQGSKLLKLQQQTSTVLFLPPKGDSTIVDIRCKGTPESVELVKTHLLQMLQAVPAVSFIIIIFYLLSGVSVTVRRPLLCAFFTNFCFFVFFIYFLLVQYFELTICFSIF